MIILLALISLLAIFNFLVTNGKEIADNHKDNQALDILWRHSFGNEESLHFESEQDIKRFLLQLYNEIPEFPSKPLIGRKLQ